MHRLSPTDHNIYLLEKSHEPVCFGAVLLLDAGDNDPGYDCARMMRTMLGDRLIGSALAHKLVQSPEHYDSCAWFRIGRMSIAKQISQPEFPQGLSRQALHEYIAKRHMVRLDPHVAAFEVEILRDIQRRQCILYVKVHHSLLDGIGFQQAICALSDQGWSGSFNDIDATDEAVPTDQEWLASAARRFQDEETLRAEHLAKKAVARAALENFVANPNNRRVAPPEIKFGLEPTCLREFGTLVFSLSRLKAIAKTFGVKINDVFLAISSGALRSYLGRRGQLPEASLVTQCARSIRTAEDGPLGNHLLAMCPELATNEPNVVARLKRINASTTVEKLRSNIEQDLLPEKYDWPYGSRERQGNACHLEEMMAVMDRPHIHHANVPGPDVPLSFCGLQLKGNFAVPPLIGGMFLSVVARGHGGMLYVSLTADPGRIDNFDELKDCYVAAYVELLSAAAS